MSGAPKVEANPVNGRTNTVPTPSVEKMIPQAPREEPRPLEKQQNEKQQNPDPPSAKMPQQVRSVARPSPPAILKHANRPVEHAPAPIQKKKEPSLSTASVINPTAPIVRPIVHPQSTGDPPVPAPQMAANIALVASPDSGPSKEALSPGLKKNESELSPPRPAESLGSVTGLVAIHTDPYPSLRISAERSSKKSSRGKSLEFGHLVSHVEPAYPEEAKQRGIEGTVRLHAIFGRDGAVENLSSVSGPPVLAAAAMNAVRDWHYSQTFLDSKPIEIEEDITVVFRLSNEAGTKN
jgi:protein TonB